jgi:coniferyl-aldehyde dehydrogenase
MDPNPDYDISDESLALREPACDDLRSLLDAQRRDFDRAGIPSIAIRRDRLDRMIALLADNADEFSAALSADFGTRPHLVNLMNDIAGILPDLLRTRKKLAKWSRPERITALSAAGLPTTIDKKPLGVVGVIGPWNFPIALVAQPAASALAAGNRVMAKFSEITPRTADLFSARVAEYFDPTEFTVITGGPTVGASFSQLPFDHLFFTGSPGVGVKVATAAAANLVPVTLELGGKNPAVVSPKADAATMARRIIAARLANGGQICLCPDYVFVPRDHIDVFVETALREARAVLSTPTGIVSLVNEANYRRVSDLIDDARRRGATIHSAGKSDAARRQLAPAIITGVTDDMAIAHEEVFGPVLAIHPYDDVGQVVDYVASRPAPLAAYWYGPAGVDFDYFRDHTTSGGMTVNDFALHCAVMVAPFGGVGHSGWGAYHGRAGFDTFTHRRTVTTSRLPVSAARMLMPPHSSAMTSAVSAYLRFTAARARRRMFRDG